MTPMPFDMTTFQIIAALGLLTVGCGAGVWIGWVAWGGPARRRELRRHLDRAAQIVCVPPKDADDGLAGQPVGDYGWLSRPGGWLAEAMARRWP